MKKILSNFEEILSGIVLLFMLALTFVNVVFRGISTSISFTEEITTALFVLLCMLGTAVAAKRQAHLGLSLVTERMKPQNQVITACVGNLLGVVLSLVMLYTGIMMAYRQYDLRQITIALQWPEWIYGSFVPIGAAFMAIRFGQAALENIKRLKEEK